nr:CBS domain-containing protein [Nitrospirota bacterium]
MKPVFKTLGNIRITNTLATRGNDVAFRAAMKLIETSFQGMPVFDDGSEILGKITEMDLLKALKAGKNLQQTVVREIMSYAPPVLCAESTLEQAVEIMDDHRLIRLPVMKDSQFIGSVTRHDLLRAWLGVWVDHERGSYAEVIG